MRDQNQKGIKTMKFNQFITIGLALLTAAFSVIAGNNSWTPLSIQEQAAYGFTHAISIDATNATGNVTNAANGTYNTLFPTLNNGAVTFPVNTRVGRVGLYVDRAFSTSTGTGDWKLNVGDSSVTNRFISAAGISTNLGSGVLKTNRSSGLIGYDADKWVYVDKGTNHIYTTATNLTFHLLGTNVNSALSYGRIQLYIQAVPLDDLRN